MFQLVDVRLIYIVWLNLQTAELASLGKQYRENPVSNITSHSLELMIIMQHNSGQVKSLCLRD